ncbi:thiol:disulfide interchange protein DsbG [Thiopseudomonas denitrificans]|uniref:Thiol:disulfide interchange protein n=1 Tax=Thiopseudomonas denitrificans TaxID=1501432 RepID=A0A4R6TV42_9GAMM|nr:thiol:disulfide interchange protein DsbG [Thiopseudomonas denitrificans]TDQ37281.1 thiol:disulfide interchange protein DsbC [Thiopseudomonas denitrificans]
MKLTRIAALVALSGLASIASAQDYPAPIEAMQAKGVEILDTFNAPGGLEGYAAIYHGRPLAIYLTSDKQHAIIGSLLDASGNDLTSPVIDEKINRPQSKVIWSKLEKDSHWVSEGSKQADKVVYVFTDPNCPYCKRFWNDAQPWVKSGKIELRHIPVGVLGEGSRKKAAYILAAKDSTKALIDNESGKAPAKENAISDQQATQLDANLQLMSQVGASGTPAILYLDETGMLQLHPGAPQGEQLVEIFGSKP